MADQVEDPLETLRHAERDVLRQIKAATPERLGRRAPVDPADLQRRIGISGIPRGPRGYIRYLAQDFVVEEVGPDGTLSTIEPVSDTTALDLTQPTLYADLVKGGIGTLEAVAHLSAAAALPPGSVGYAGLKDGRAVTSQRVSLRPAAAYSRLANRVLPQLFLKPRGAGKGATAVGALRGNRFTILVRTEAAVDHAWLSRRLGELGRDGFANFYGPQRFGTRLWNPHLGRLLCRGEFAEAVRVYLTEPGPFDAPLYRELRAQAAAAYGDWGTMLSVFDQLPYTFRHERALLAALRERPADFYAALLAIRDQVRFWVFGYSSFLVNQLLARALSSGVAVPDPLPIAITGPRADILYQEFLRRDGTAGYVRSLQPFPFFLRKDRALQPWIVPRIHGAVVVAPGAVISFTLPRAAYATTFLLFLFQLAEGTPVPPWVRPEPLDVKEVLGTGSVAAALKALGMEETPVPASPARDDETAS